MLEWEQQLVEAGYRLTAARRTVIRIMAAAAAPLSPHEVCRRGRRLQPALGLASVYRALGLLEELGLVRRLHQAGGCHGYVPASPGHCHTIVCRSCGRVAEFPGGEDLAGLADRVRHETGYRVEDHLLQLEGLCPRCQGG